LIRSGSPELVGVGAIGVKILNHRIIEFAVFHHFGPYASINTLSQVFNELTVNVFFNGLARIGKVNGYPVNFFGTATGN
jgi:hypothetical protein